MFLPNYIRDSQCMIRSFFSSLKQDSGSTDRRIKRCRKYRFPDSGQVREHADYKEEEHGK